MFFMNSEPIREKSHDQKNLIFNKNNYDIFLNDLKNGFFPLSSMYNLEYLYHNFTTILSYSINGFSIEVSINKKNRRTNPWYDKERKNARLSIKEAIEESLKIDKINRYKAQIKNKNCII